MGRNNEQAILKPEAKINNNNNNKKKRFDNSGNHQTVIVNLAFLFPVCSLEIILVRIISKGAADPKNEIRPVIIGCVFVEVFDGIAI